LIKIRAANAGERKLWLTLLKLAERERHWTLIGARMVELHVRESRRVGFRASLDADALGEARRKPSAVTRLSQILLDEGFELDEPSAFGLAHRFVADGVEIDVLVPENLGSRAQQAKTTIPPAHTVEVPGGPQALDRTEWVDIEVDGIRGALPRPNLLGAILIKARAVEVDDVPDNQLSDVALLLSLVEDPEEMRGALRGEERSWLRRRSEMDDPRARCWAGLDDDAKQRGLSALRILAGFAAR
jgi:hypothetical protein